MSRETWKRIPLIVVVLAVMVMGPGMFQGAQGQGKLSFSIATGGTGGVWYPLGGAIGGIVSKNVPNTDATAEATAAAIDNLKLLTAGRAGLAFCYDYHVVWAADGKVPGLPGKHNVRMVMGFYEQPLHIATKEGMGVKTLMDLKGKRVSTGAPNSGTEEQADYVLKGVGIDWNKDLKREKLGATESVAALKDGKIQAFFWSGAIPTSSIIDLASTPGLKMILVPVGGENAEKIMKTTPGVFHKTVFAKGCYTGVESDIDTIGITAIVTAMDTFPQDKVYQILGAIFGGLTEISAVWKDATKLTPEKAAKLVTPDALKYLHPGAQRFFKEKGVLK